MSKKEVKIGIIGGTGLGSPEILLNSKEVDIDTPYGKPSDKIKLGTISGISCALIPRHGRKHSISPTNVNYRANIWAFKSLGCTHVLATTACGSLREEIVPGDMVFIDQFIDKTWKRENTFYDGTPGGPEGICHIPMNPICCNATRDILIEAAKKLDIKHHKRGTLVCIEGPRFSTKAESNLYRSWKADLVGMTLVPEVVLAKELALCYASVALATDYDCWKEEIGGVDAESALAMFKKHCEKTVAVLKLAIEQIAANDWSKEWQNCDVVVKKATMGV